MEGLSKTRKNIALGFLISSAFLMAVIIFISCLALMYGQGLYTQLNGGAEVLNFQHQPVPEVDTMNSINIMNTILIVLLSILFVMIIGSLITLLLK